MEPKPRMLVILDSVAPDILHCCLRIGIFLYAYRTCDGQRPKSILFPRGCWLGGHVGFLGRSDSRNYLLGKGERKWDIVGVSAIEIGMVFAFINIVTGSIWARPIWNTWWTWDPRLTTATIMELIYAAYFMLRAGIEDPNRRARFGAVYAIIGFVSVPMTFFSARLFRTIHPTVIGSNQPGAEGDFAMSPAMLQTFMFSLLTFSIVFADILWHRVRFGRLADKVEQLKLKTMG